MELIFRRYGLSVDLGKGAGVGQHVHHLPSGGIAPVRWERPVALSVGRRRNGLCRTAGQAVAMSMSMRSPQASRFQSNGGSA